MMKRKKAAPGPGQDTVIAQEAKAALAQTPPPSVTDPNVIDAVELENKKAKKRKGRASTVLGGAYDAPMTDKTVMGSF